MIFVTGGFAQGKLEYVMEKYGYDKKDVFDIEKSQIADWQGQPVIYNAQDLVTLWLKNGDNIEERTTELCRRMGDGVIISNEVGCGIVPINKEMREWRESVGRMNCVISRCADTVERVLCGIGMTLKR